TGTWKDHSGPIAMFPGAPPLHAFVPRGGAPVQRLGDATSTVLATATTRLINDGPPSDLPANRVAGRIVDHGRVTVPTTISTGWWMDNGGMAKDGINPKMLVQNFTATQNAYQQMYNCRDAYYLGSTVSGLKRWMKPDANTTAFPKCK